MFVNGNGTGQKNLGKRKTTKRLLWRFFSDNHSPWQITPWLLLAIFAPINTQ